MRRPSLALIPLALAALVAAAPASALEVTVYDDALLVPTGTDSIRLLGFGRGGSVLPDLTPDIDPGFEFFFDTWNIQTNLVEPNLYSFTNLFVEAADGLTFISVSLSSYDAEGVRNTVLFDLNAEGTQAIGSGEFTVLASCPVQSCVWIDVVGIQPIGGTGGYGGDGIATAVVPEPATWALMLGGAAALFGFVGNRRRRQSVS